MPRGVNSTQPTPNTRDDIEADEISTVTTISTETSETLPFSKRAFFIVLFHTFDISVLGFTLRHTFSIERQSGWWKVKVSFQTMRAKMAKKKAKRKRQ